jgi:hypothetical protein
MGGHTAVSFPYRTGKGTTTDADDPAPGCRRLGSRQAGLLAFGSIEPRWPSHDRTRSQWHRMYQGSRRSQQRPCAGFAPDFPVTSPLVPRGMHREKAMPTLHHAQDSYTARDRSEPAACLNIYEGQDVMSRDYPRVGTILDLFRVRTQRDRGDLGTVMKGVMRERGERNTACQ